MGDMTMTLKEKLNDWTDLDVAQYELSLVLGIFTPEQSFQSELKHVFWSNNPTGNMLYNMILDLVERGYLEFDEDEYRVRWKEKI